MWLSYYHRIQSSFLSTLMKYTKWLFRYSMVFLSPCTWFVEYISSYYVILFNRFHCRWLLLYGKCFNDRIVSYCFNAWKVDKWLTIGHWRALQIESVAVVFAWLSKCYRFMYVSIASLILPMYMLHASIVLVLFA